ncbi:MAG: hypothetical protein FWC50_11545 [Planctomycetaceae bacterium]|nr:hypothetical protein [Planctomycetaceae bacterium]
MSNQRRQKFAELKAQITGGLFKRKNELFEAIAKEILDIETLKIRNHTPLDFHSIAVWEMENALQAAYFAGQKATVVPEFTWVGVKDGVDMDLFCGGLFLVRIHTLPEKPDGEPGGCELRFVAFEDHLREEAYPHLQEGESLRLESREDAESLLEKWYTTVNGLPVVFHDIEKLHTGDHNKANQQARQNELCEWQKNIVLREKLKEFVDSADPIVEDEEYGKHLSNRIWNDYMLSAAQSYHRAKRALNLRDDRAAYWNALHAMAAAEAASEVLEHDDEQTACVEAIIVYHDSLTCIREAEPELAHAFAKKPAKE